MSVKLFQFGEFEFDSESRALTHKGREVRLQAQPALLLGILLAQRDRIVSRDELQLVIWGSDTHVDFEKGLNFCVGQVRTALRDDASRPLYIRTIPKQGYQFIAPVSTIGEQTPAAETGDNAIPSPRGLHPLSIVFVGVSAAVLGAVTFLVWPKALAVPNLAVVRFDPGTDQPAIRSLADELSDDITVRLTSASNGHYRVIGNASILRLPREQRDLRSIASSLRCQYAVLGQVQTNGDRVLVLAHLIRLSDLTHIWVARCERTTHDPSTLESQIATEIASQFAASMGRQPDKAGSFGAGNH